MGTTYYYITCLRYYAFAIWSYHGSLEREKESIEILIRNEKTYYYRKFDHLKVIGYSDFARCVDTKKKKIIFGYMFLSARGVISWKSVKQSIIAASTMV